MHAHLVDGRLVQLLGRRHAALGHDYAPLLLFTIPNAVCLLLIHVAWLLFVEVSQVVEQLVCEIHALNRGRNGSSELQWSSVLL